MITAKDVEFHYPSQPDYNWAETNFFSFYVADRNLCGSIYVVMRPSLGVAFAEITLFDMLSRDRADCLYIDSRQHMPLPDRLSDYSLPMGLSVRATRAPHDYTITYAGGRGVGFELSFTALMDPHANHSPPAAAGENAQASEDARAFAFYKGHFDMVGHVRGSLSLAGESVAIDCVDTMDHSWGPRPEDGMGGGMAGGCWLHAHFGADYVLHALLVVDPSLPSHQQYRFVRGFVLKDGATELLVDGRLTPVRYERFAIGLALEVTDSGGVVHRAYGSAVAGTMVAWYSSVDTFYALHRWTSPTGRVGYGCAMEGYMMPVLTGRRGLAIPAGSSFA
jgi:hypothetical protein